MQTVENAPDTRRMVVNGVEVVLHTGPETEEVDIIAVEGVGAYCLRLKFSAGHETNVDFGPFLTHSRHPDIRRYLEPALFAGYTLEDGNLIWNNGDLEFPLADLYDGTIR